MDSITLSAKDWQAFLRQVRYGRPKKAAREACRRGAALVAEYNRKGYATIRPGALFPVAQDTQDLVQQD